MSEQLLTVLKLCLLALLYLFFLRVLRAVWAQVLETAPAADPPARQNRRSRRRPPVATPAAPATTTTAATPPPSPTRRPMAAAPRQLVGIDGNGSGGAAFGLAAEMTIGRAPTCTIEVDDTYASAVHTRVFRREDGWYVEDLGSTNGTRVNDARVAEQQLRDGDEVRFGNTVMHFQAS